jgi:predicted ABC-type ATPase
MSGPILVLLAGPNGAGKSTYYRAFLSKSGLKYLNADDIAAKIGLSVGDAARAADALRSELLQTGESFITETVFSDPVGAKLQFMRDALAKGYTVTLIYIGLAGADLSEARVVQRVGEGGHDVPSDRLLRRYNQSLLNLRAAMEFVPKVRVYDNSSDEEPFRLIFELDCGRMNGVSPFPMWLTHLLRH